MCNDGAYAVVEEECDICHHECVAVMPIACIGMGCECEECGNMSMYPKEDPDGP